MHETNASMKKLTVMQIKMFFNNGFLRYLNEVAIVLIIFEFIFRLIPYKNNNIKNEKN